MPSRGHILIGVRVAFVWLFLASCAHTRPVSTQPAAQPLAPLPLVYRQWWSQVEGCAGRTGDISKVNWYTVPGAFVVERDRLYNGFWFKETNTIVLPEKRLGDPNIVRHEMLHALLETDRHTQESTGACSALVAPP